MPNQSGLINLRDRTKEEHTAMSRKGGSVQSEKKRVAAKLRWVKRWIKEGKIKGDPMWLVERLESSNAMSMDMLSYLDSIKDDIHPSQRVALMNAYDRVQRTLHGEKKHVDVTSTNININVSASLDDVWGKRKGAPIDVVGEIIDDEGGEE